MKVGIQLIFLILVSVLHAAFLYAEPGTSSKQGVVKIHSEFDGKRRVGTGFIVDLDDKAAYLVTAAHVIEGDVSPKVSFYSAPTQQFDSHVVGSDGGNSKGLAVLIVEGSLPEELAVLSLAKKLSIEGEEKVTLIGFPRAIGIPWAPLPGSVIGLRGPDLVFSAAADEGNSGGPVILNNQVIGVVVEAGSGFGTAVPAPTVRVALDGWGVSAEVSSAFPSHAQVETDISGDSADDPEIENIRTGFPPVIHHKDGAPMVLIPGGKFLMGSKEGFWGFGNEGPKEEQPQHGVYVKDFYIDQYEVTTERYSKFLKDTQQAAPQYWTQVKLSIHGDKPIVGVTWHDAQAYCSWANKRLPTAAEWEKAARGTDGRTYPWGEFTPNSSTANFGKLSSDRMYEDRLKPVGTYERGRSPYGVYDMAGNVWEWVADWYAEDYYRMSSLENPQGPETGEAKALRGGSWYTSKKFLRSATRGRNVPTYRDSSGGMRCAKDADKQ